MERNRIYKILDVLCLALLLAITIFTVVNWGNFGDNITTHVNIKGEADGTGGKGTVIMLLVIAFIMFVVISIIEKFPNAWNIPIKITDENRERVYACAKDMIKVMKLEAVALMSASIVGIIIDSRQVIFIGAMVGVGVIILTTICGLVRIIKNK